MTSTKEEVLRMFDQLTNPSCLDESVEIHPRPILGHVIPEAVKSKNLPLCHVDNAHWEAGSLCPKSVEVCLCVSPLFFVVFRGIASLDQILFSEPSEHTTMRNKPECRTQDHLNSIWKKSCTVPKVSRLTVIFQVLFQLLVLPIPTSSQVVVLAGRQQKAEFTECMWL